jgi:hypothetical protein
MRKRAVLSRRTIIAVDVAAADPVVVAGCCDVCGDA